MNQKSSRRGFAGMDPTRQRVIASQGGHAAHDRGAAHEFTPEQARTAGKKGGETISKDREHMANIGRLGGIRRAEARKKRLEEEAAAKAAVIAEAPPSSTVATPPETSAREAPRADETPRLATAPAA